MVEFVEEFLKEAEKKQQQIDKLLPLFKKNKHKDTDLSVLYDFIYFVYLTAPFFGFLRCYRLAELALKQLKRQDDVQCIVPKFERISEILKVAYKIKRENTGDDEDLFDEVSLDIDDSAFSYIDNVNENKDLTKQIADLDKREADLVLWSEKLEQQDANFKKKENILFKKERQKEILDKELMDLANTIKEQENANVLMQNKLEEKEKKLEIIKEESRKIAQFIASREEQETQLAIEFEAKEKEIAERDEKILYFENEQEKQKQEYQLLDERYEKTLEYLSDVTEKLEDAAKLEADLKQQHLDLNLRLVTMQENLSIKTDEYEKAKQNLKNIQEEFDEAQADFIAMELPYNAEKIQQDLTVLLKHNTDEISKKTLSSLIDLTKKIRTRSFSNVPLYLKQIVDKKSSNYNRHCFLSVENTVTGHIDKDLLRLLRDLLPVLCDNSFRYCYPQKNEILKLTFKAQETGGMLNIVFSDNGASFDFDKLYHEIFEQGLLSPTQKPMTQGDLLPFLLYKSSKNEKSLPVLAKHIENMGGKINLYFNHGLFFEFSLPKQSLFDLALTFSFDSKNYALPMNAIIQTVIIDKEQDSFVQLNDDDLAFVWQDEYIPVVDLNLSVLPDLTDYGLVVQAGGYRFLLMVDQILETEQILSFSNEYVQTFLRQSVLFDSGRTVNFINLSDFILQSGLSLPKPNMDSIKQDESKPFSAESSYLIFKTDTESYGAVPVSKVLQVAEFSLNSDERTCTIGDKVLPLIDSCNVEGFPNAQAMLIFETYALSILEIVDIIELNAPLESETDTILYQDNRVNVYPTTL